ncbi:glycosyltransferase family 31 protein [Diaporthe eres]|uniref:N-acetylgalactosaminide beta-1,3-galactosyltransferase n=1 Tax=Diaporthe vaccinii TaxID=105482 RepID=A0ABR4E7R5_9PEZI|nr:glycosyltransferase family 31 protein [Diaporthe eres]
MPLHWRRRRRSLLGLRLLTTSTALVILFLWATLPYDNALRSSARFNTHRLVTFLRGPLRNERWLYEPPAFPVDWSRDVGIILKTGYGTQERALAWIEALPTGISPENVIIVGDFDAELATSGGARSGLRVHDVVARIAGEKLVECEGARCPRAEKYLNLKAAISAGEDRLARNYSSSFGWELDAMKFIPSLELAYRAMPDRKWFILVDDDTYLIYPSLNFILGHFDPSMPYYLGNAVGDYRQRFAHGGSSIALSRATMQALFAPSNHHAIAKARRASLTETWGDRLLADALLRLGVPVDEDASRFFNGEQPWASRLRPDRLCAPVATFHRLSTAGEMADVGRVFRDAVDPVLWVDLWEMFAHRGGRRRQDRAAGARPSISQTASPHEYGEVAPGRSGWDHVGQLDENTETFAGVKAALGCSHLCSSRKKCLAWTWDEGKMLCHLSPWVTVGREAVGLRSGLNVDRFRGLADDCG